jgi:curli biogenesis system outer membrane secretion channel CsgG
MIARYLVGGLFLLALLTACAKVAKPEVQTIPSATPDISKTLQTDQTRTLKRVVAIARFSNETNYGKGVYLNNENTLGKQAMDIFSAKMANTGKFIMLERADLEFVDKEVEFSGSSQVKVPADYLVIGSITDFGRKNTGEVGMFSRTQKQTAFAKVHIRLINVKTGQIIYGEEGEGEASLEAGTVLGMGAQTGYDSTLNDKAIEAAISKLINNIINNLLNIPWKSYILGESAGSWIISGGKTQGIAIGDEFSVYQKGETVTNPQTNLPIELPGSKVATIRVNGLSGDTADNEMSLCTLVDGKIDPAQTGKYYVQASQK